MAAKKKRRKKKTGGKTMAGKKRKRPARKGEGRPTALNAEVQDTILKALTVGGYHETAAGVAGIQASTLRDWLRRGARERRRLAKDPKAKAKKTEKPYAEFSAACEKAQADSELGDLATIARASRKQWQAAAWRLERKYPDRYGRRDRHEVVGRGGAPIRVLTEVSFVDAADDQE